MGLLFKRARFSDGPDRDGQHQQQGEQGDNEFGHGHWVGGFQSGQRQARYQGAAFAVVQFDHRSDVDVFDAGTQRFQKLAGGERGGFGFVLRDPGLSHGQVFGVDRPDAGSGAHVGGDADAPGFGADAGPEAVLPQAHAGVLRVGADGVEKRADFGLLGGKGLVGGQDAQARGRAVDPHGPGGVVRQEGGDAPPRDAFGAPLPPEMHGVNAVGQAAGGQQRDKGARQRDADAVHLPAHQGAQAQQHHETPIEPARWRAGVDVHVGEQGAWGVEAVSAVGVARNDGVAVA